MAAIDSTIAELEATFDQKTIETNMQPEETKDLEVSHPNKTTRTTRRVYNLRKGKNGDRRRNYSHSSGDHSMALMQIVLT